MACAPPPRPSHFLHRPSLHFASPPPPLRFPSLSPSPSTLAAFPRFRPPRRTPHSAAAAVKAVTAPQSPEAAAAALVDDSGSVLKQDDHSVPLKKVLVPIAYGTDEMEAIILLGVLRGAGANVTLASVEPQLEVETSGRMRIVADALVGSCIREVYDLVALPGGMPGSARLRDCEVLQNITSKQAEEKRLYGAICAAPAITLLPWGLMKKKQHTGHPAFKDELPRFWAVKSDVQVSGELTTSRGPGTSFKFALSLVEQLFDESASKAIRDSLFASDSDDFSKQKEVNMVDWSINHSPRVLVPVANGTEEMQVAVIVDILRRAKVDVVIASVEKSLRIVASQGCKIVANCLIGKALDTTYDMIILPVRLYYTLFSSILTGYKTNDIFSSGKGDGIVLERLNKSRILKNLLKEHESSDRLFGAIFSSAAPAQEVSGEKKATPLSSLVDKFRETFVEGVGIVIDGKIITGCGLAKAPDFALAIVTKLFGLPRARCVAEALVYEYRNK
ncbi:DJ-1 homolog C-like protein [Drosera capensis]